MAKGQKPMAEKPKNFRATLKKLLVSLKKYYLQIIISLLFAGVSTVLSIIGPDQIQKIGKLILKTPIEFNEITKIAIGLCIIYGCSFLFGYIQNFIMSGVTSRIGKTYRTSLSKKINNLPLSYLDKTQYGDILSRVTNDVDLLTNTLNDTLSSSITSITTIIGSLIMMFSYSTKLTLIGLVIIPISMVVILLMFKISQKYFKLQQDKLGDINGHIEEIYSGHNVVTIYGGEKIALEQFDAINNDLYKASLKGNVLSGLIHPIMHFFGNVGYAFIIIIGGISAINNISLAPMLIAFVSYYRMFNNQITQVASISSTVQTTLAASERIFEFLDEPEQENEKSKPNKLEITKGDIEFRHVNFGYLPEKQIIFDLNEKIKGGQKVAIVGSTGAGKTTLVNLLMRFYEIDSGEILIDGVNISSVRREAVRKCFGMVLQDTWLFEGTIKDNITYGRNDVTMDDVINVCKSAGIHHLIMSQPKGYDMVITEDSNFSAGEKQLITIARAMLNNSPMLILDEATSSVDTRTEVLIQKAMDKLQENRTAFVIAHRLSTIVNADLILVMKDGNVVESGKHKELIELNGVYASLYKSQF